MAQLPLGSPSCVLDLFSSQKMRTLPICIARTLLIFLPYLVQCSPLNTQLPSLPLSAWESISEHLRKDQDYGSLLLASKMHGDAIGHSLAIAKHLVRSHPKDALTFTTVKELPADVLRQLLHRPEITLNDWESAVLAACDRNLRGQLQILLTVDYYQQDRPPPVDPSGDIRHLTTSSLPPSASIQPRRILSQSFGEDGLDRHAHGTSAAKIDFLSKGPLERAIRTHSTPIVVLLLEHGADPTLDNFAAWELTAKEGTPEILKVLSGVIGVHRGDGVALLVAAKAGNSQNVAWLLENGSQRDGRNIDQNVLTLASMHGHLNTVRVLLEQGHMDVHHNNDEALRRAIEHDQVFTVAYLLDKDADYLVNNNMLLQRSLDRCNAPMLRVIFEKTPLRVTRDNLYVAVDHCMDDVVQVLLRYHAPLMPTMPTC